jgi:pyruvate formate lyase activating enzyme
MCKPAEGKPGKCGVRRNLNGELITETYRKVSAIHYDPIEKKPLYHFHPGSIILSIGSIGCNLDCSFCQNCDISKADVSGFPWYKDYPVEDIISMAKDYPGNIGVSFTYNEPTISYEYMLEISRLAASVGLKTTMVTNGFINPDPLIQLLPFMDAFNVDLKAFREEFYRQHTDSRLEPVLETLRILKEAGKHFEITNLVIPDLNDDPEAFTGMIDWIAGELGEYSVLHLSRYFPHHRMTRKATPLDTLTGFYGIARQKLQFVYLGNMMSDEGQNTYCPQCNELLIRRNGYRTDSVGLLEGPRCRKCETFIQNLII